MSRIAKIVVFKHTQDFLYFKRQRYFQEYHQVVVPHCRVEGPVRNLSTWWLVVDFYLEF